MRFEVDLTKSPGPPVQSLGFNQIDDKNAFIAQERISYARSGPRLRARLGERRGRGGLCCNDPKCQDPHHNHAGNCEGKLKDLIVLQTLEFDVQYHQIERNPSFTPKYSPELQSSWKDFNGFMGVLTIEGRRIPVFNTFVRRPEYSEPHSCSLMQRIFCAGDSFAPDHEPDEQTHYG